MFVTLKRLYNLNLFSKEQLVQSVECDWITEEEYTEITGENYPEEPQA